METNLLVVILHLTVTSQKTRRLFSLSTLKLKPHLFDFFYGFLLILLPFCSQWVHQCQGLTRTPHSFKWQQFGESCPGQISTPTSKPPDGPQPQARPPSHHLTGWKEPHADGEPHRAELVISQDHKNQYFILAKYKYLFSKREQNIVGC